MGPVSVEIVCTACGAESLVRREPKFDGFKKVGERFFCSACGHEFPDEEQVPFKQKQRASVFSEDDRSAKVEVFADEEKDRNCRHCRHYTVNPFTQRCGLHGKVVEATDLCDDFNPPDPPDPPETED